MCVGCIVQELLKPQKSNLHDSVSPIISQVIQLLTEASFNKTAEHSAFQVTGNQKESFWR